MYDKYVKTESCREVVRRFITHFPGVRSPHRDTMRNLVNKLRGTGSLLDKKRSVKKRVLNEEKVNEISERLEHPLSYGRP